MRPDPQRVQVTEPDSDESRSPVSYLAVKLDDQTRTTLEAWLHLHLAQINTEMQPILARFQQEDDQVEGNMPGADYPYAGAFRVNYPLTKRKVREIANRIKQAYLDADPIWGIDLDDPNLFQLAIRLEKTLDTAMDYELDEEDDLALACYEAAKHGLGVIVPTWAYHEERMRTLESWQGWDGLRLDTLRDIIRFEEKYPNWREQKGLRDIHARLNRGQEVEREITEIVAVKNHPDFQHIEAKQVRVYPSVHGYEGLRATPLYGYLVNQTQFELDAFRDQETIDEEALARVLPAVTKHEDADPQAQMEEFEIFKGTIRYALPEDGGTPGRYHVWYAVKEQVLLRARFYPWWHAEPDLIPCYVRMEETGFFKPGIAHDVVDEHTVLNVLLNLYLNGLDMANALRLKTKYRSLSHQLLLSKRWSPHMGLPWKDHPNEIDPMAQPMGHLTAIVNGFQLLKQQGDDASGTTTLQSGRESPSDPSAPGIKTIALLQQVQPNEKDILRSLAPAFDAVGRWTMWMYFQALKLGWIEQLPGGLQIPPEMLPELAKHLHSRAILFDLDRQGRFERDVGLLRIAQEILGPTRPDVILKMLRITISQAGSQWSRLVDSLDLERAPVTLPTEPGGTEAEVPTPSTNGHRSPPGDPLAGFVNRLGAQVGVGT